MHELVPHPAFAAQGVERLTAGVARDGSRLVAEYHLEGDLDRLYLPIDASSTRADGLWRTTCFEMFWQGKEGSPYAEFNFSPSGQWAAYRFQSPRTGQENLPVTGMAISKTLSNSGLRLRAEIDCQLPSPAVIALTAVIEDAEGNHSYWALHHFDDKPDFHDPRGRTIHMENT